MRPHPFGIWSIFQIHYKTLQMKGILPSPFTKIPLRNLVDSIWRPSKRLKIEEMESSYTVDELLNLVGRGRIDISCATDIARAVLKDGIVNQRVEKLCSLGNWGLSQSNCERDLHTWLRNLFGLRLEPYHVVFDLEVRCGSSKRINLQSHTSWNTLSWLDV